MTFYEIIISRPNDRAVIIEGSENLYAARNMLHAEAEQGNIPGVSKVDIYDVFQAPADVLGALPKFRLTACRNICYRVFYSYYLGGNKGENDAFKRDSRGIGWTDN